MSIPKLVVAEFLLRLGLPGAIGSLLLLASLGYGAAVLLPAHAELAALEQRVARAERLAALAPGAALAAPLSTASRRQQFFATLPAQGDLLQCLERIYAVAASEQLTLQHGEYSGAEIPDARLVRYRLVLPLQGGYLQIRHFISAATAAVPGLVLDDLSLQRHNVGDAQLAARVQLSLYLAKP